MPPQAPFSPHRPLPHHPQHHPQHHTQRLPLDQFPDHQPPPAHQAESDGALLYPSVHEMAPPPNPAPLHCNLGRTGVAPTWLQMSDQGLDPMLSPQGPQSPQSPQSRNHQAQQHHQRQYPPSQAPAADPRPLATRPAPVPQRRQQQLQQPPQQQPQQQPQPAQNRGGYSPAAPGGWPAGPPALRQQGQKGGRGGARSQQNGFNGLAPGLEPPALAVGAVKAHLPPAAAPPATATPSGKQVHPSERTTVMLKNLPVGLSREMLTEVLDKTGFAGSYDFVYVPVSFRTKASMCYAFVNMATPDSARACFGVLNGFTKWPLPTDKVCEITWSDKLQGLMQHIERYRNSPLMHPNVPDDFKPAVFQDGRRMHFPPATKALRPPRIRRNSEDEDEDEAEDEDAAEDGAKDDS
uniref:Mei2-like C-terminal RNA recognition motif domain-containing protein n=1 Tax=Zooxanthella nutricula TaxID=1333877 RepID=A0A7S2LV30_9DINO